MLSRDFVEPVQGCRETVLLIHDLVEPIQGCREPVLGYCDLVKPICEVVVVCEVTLAPCEGTMGWILIFYLSHELIVGLSLNFGLFVGSTLNVGLFIRLPINRGMLEKGTSPLMGC